MLFFIENQSKQILIVFPEISEVIILAGIRVMHLDQTKKVLRDLGGTHHWSVLFAVQEPSILRFGTSRKLKLDRELVSLLGLNNPHITLSVGDLYSVAYFKTSLVLHLLEQKTCQRLLNAHTSVH